MKIEQYIQMMDYALWDVIENSPTLQKTQVVKGVTTFMPITSIEDKAQKRLEVKARSTLMMGIPNEHQLKFNSIKDAKQLMQAIEKRFELLGEKISQEDVNQRLLISLSPEWNTHAVVWRNKADLDTMSMDDIYNNLKGHFARECRAPRSQDTNHKESTRRTVPVETPALTYLVSCDGLGGYDWSDQAEKVQTMHSWLTHLQVQTPRSKTVNTARPKAVVNAVKENVVNVVKASAYYEEIDGGCVAFGGNPKGEKITRKDVQVRKTIESVFGYYLKFDGFGMLK
nr:hypothetical protein [Tanacetum cinerariifolium]